MATRQIRITLTEEQFQALKAEAERERRTLSQQAAYRLTRPDPDEAQVIQPYWPPVPLPHICPTTIPAPIIPTTPGITWWQRTDSGANRWQSERGIYE